MNLAREPSGPSAVLSTHASGGGAGAHGRSRRYGHRRAILQCCFGLVALVVALGSAGAAWADPARILALGDSLTAGYLLPLKDAFPSVLEAELRKAGHDVRVVNAGVSGDTATDALERLDWALEPGTRYAIVEVGANDMLRGVDPKVPRAALETILGRLKARGVRVLVAGMYAAPGLGAGYEKAFDAIYPDLASKYGFALYPFFLAGVHGHPELQLSDGMHPNAAGVRVMVSGILPDVEGLIAEPSATK